MLAAYICAYLTAIALMALGCWIPAMLFAFGGFWLAYHHDFKAAPQRGRDLVARVT